MTDISPERPEDKDQVEALFDLAFAPGRANLSSYRLRAGTPQAADLCLVARDDFDMVVGAIRYWPIRIGAPEAESAALLLGPVAVHPIRQSEGLGSRLILDSLERARRAGWRACVLVGDEPYYRRFGFRRALAEAIAFPQPTNPARILGLELQPGGLAGVAGPARPWTDAGAAS